MSCFSEERVGEEREGRGRGRGGGKREGIEKE